MHENQKKVFFAFDVCAPWPDKLPKGRIISVESRHLTLAFLGNIDFPKLQNLLTEIPKLPFRVGFTGIFDQCLFLPEKHPHVVAYHIKWFESALLMTFQNKLAEFLRNNGYSIEERPFLSHVTLARTPFNQKEWLKAFTPLPVLIQNMHLYESLGNLNYQPIWSHLIDPPFVELDHTADLAFLIQAESIDSLYFHALSALLFKYPALIPFIKEFQAKNSLNEIIIYLNELISHVDSAIGCPFKAVSFHGDLKKEEGLIKWEMIVDV